MQWLGRWQLQPGWIEAIAIGGLLVAIAIAGLFGLGINAQVRQLTEEALAYDFELEDRGDDFRVAVLDLRHYHRNITFAGPTRRGLADFEAAYLQLHQQINQLEDLGINDPTAPQAAGLRAMAERYYAEFRPSIELYHSDKQAFDLASDQGLVRLSAMEDAGLVLENLGETLADSALGSMEAAERSSRTAMIAVLGGLILVSAGLAYLIIKNSRERRQTAVQLAQALKLKNDFIADASHELRTPLTVLRANAEVALDLDRSCVHTDMLEEIVKESARMTRLVENLLFLARSDSGALPLDTKLVELAPFLDEVVGRAAILARRHGATLRTDWSANGVVEIDPAQIEQVILILVDNAGKYGPAGEPILLRSATRDGELVIEVIDRGPGIAAQDLALIFERFYRVDKARGRQRGGFGLGLAIAKAIVEAHSGHIEAASVPNQGTTIRFSLPLVTPLLPPDAPAARIPASVATPT